MWSFGTLTLKTLPLGGGRFARLTQSQQLKVTGTSKVCQQFFTRFNTNWKKCVQTDRPLAVRLNERREIETAYMRVGGGTKLAFIQAFYPAATPNSRRLSSGQTCVPPHENERPFRSRTFRGAERSHHWAMRYLR